MELEMLQPFGMKKMNVDLVLPAMMQISGKFWTVKGGLYHVPHCWGSEAISWRTDQTALD